MQRSKVVPRRKTLKGRIWVAIALTLAFHEKISFTAALKARSVEKAPSRTVPSPKSFKAVTSKSPSKTAIINKDDGKQSLSAATFNMVKAAIGTGVLALPAGLAAIGDTKDALVPAVAIMSVLGVFSAYSFYSIGRLCSLEKTKSLTESWEKVVGKDSAWLITAACFVTPLGAALSFSISLGSFFSSLARTAGLTGIATKRQTSIAIITLFVIYPLCLLKSLAALAPVSIIGVIAIIMTAVFMGTRLVDGTYSEGGRFIASLEKSLRPSFGLKPLKVFAPTSLILGSMAATAYLVHFMAPDFYINLENHTMNRYGTLTMVGFAVTALLSILMMVFGFMTFGGNSAGMVLNNYSTADVGATLCRFLMAISLIGSYPFAFASMKSAFIQMTNKDKKISDAANVRVTRLLLGIITVVALVLENVGFVVGLNGAIMGSAIIYIFPSIMYLKSTAKRLANGSLKDSNAVRLEQMFNRFLVAFGILCVILGGGVTIADAFYPQLLQ